MYSILIRVLLSITLVLNGSGLAMASTHAQMGQGDNMSMSPVLSQAETASVQPPCLQQHDAASSSSASELSVAMPETQSAAPKHASPQCCQSVACACACVSPAQAAIAVHALPDDVARDAGNLRPGVRGYPAPVLPHLIRPPIV